ncbi:MAG TPA: type II secretion system secretin GspD [Rhodocyclaceae bacterium]|nr:type II secretion system secretin GspD [Rhodocyclaceae bacterium]
MISGRNFLIDPRVKGTLNIVSAKPVPRELTYQILLSSLRLQGYAAVEANGVTTILPESDAKLHGSQVNVVGSPEGAGTVGRPAVRGGGNRLVTQVYPLKHESASQLVPILRPLIAPNNTIAAYTNNNTLVITDYAENIARLTKIIDAVDQPQDDVVVVPVVHGSAVDLAATLNRLFGDGTAAAAAAGGDASQRFSALAEHRSNHVLIRSGNTSKLAGARQLLASLDVPGAAGNIHVVYLKNAEATKVAQTLRAVMSGDTSTPAPPSGTSSSAASAQNLPQGTASGGMVQADVASNALIITAPDAAYNNLRRVIDQLDRRRAQVFVEALIAEVSAERAAEFGIQWQSTKGIGSAGNPKLFGGTNFGAQPGQNIISTALDPSSVGKGLNLMVTEGTLSIGGKTITNLGVLARLLESDAKTNILSTPNLVTLDNEEAKIVIGQNVPFVTGQFTSTAGTATNPFQTIERKDVGLMLKIKPQISEGGTIKLLISQEASSVSTNSDAGLVTNKRSLDSTVLADDGAIIALGGLIQDSYESGMEKVPWLGDIPFLGALFRYETRKRTRTNLVIFLRPQILRDRNDYSGLTQSRYDFVVGEQLRLDPPGRLMKDEPPGPVLPEVPPPASPSVVPPPVEPPPTPAAE